MTDKQILQVIKNTNEAQQLKFQYVSQSPSGNLKLEMNLNTSASKGAALHLEITMALDIFDIQVINIYANSRWFQFVIHDIPQPLAAETPSEVENTITNEIFQSRGVSLAQPPRWLTNEETISSGGSGTIIISVPGTVNFAGVQSVAIFNRHCRIMKVRPDLQASRCHECQQYEHHEETCPNSARCSVCDSEHAPEGFKCLSKTCGRGQGCTHASIRYTNSSPRAARYKASHNSCPARAKILALSKSPTANHLPLA